MSTDLELLILILSPILVAIQAYLVYRVDKSRLRIERYVGIGEKSELEIRPRIQNERTELIDITNKGIVPIEELHARMNVLIKRRNQADLSFSLRWERKTLLSAKETAVIHLSEKLYDFFRKNKLITIDEIGPFTVEDPETGEDIDDFIEAARLAKPFSLMLDMEIESKMQGQKNTVRKKYWLSYTWRVPPFHEYEDDYTISINEHMGEWID